MIRILNSDDNFVAIQKCTASQYDQNSFVHSVVIIQKSTASQDRNPPDDSVVIIQIFSAVIMVGISLMTILLLFRNLPLAVMIGILLSTVLLHSEIYQRPL